MTFSRLDSPYIAKGNGGYKETIQISVEDKGEVNVEFEIPLKPKLEHEIEMWDTINSFEEESWQPNKLGLDSGYKSINKAFDGGIKSGFIIIGADSNVGKTQLITQLAWQIVENNEDVYVMDFSLDDPMDDKLSRVVASRNKVLINAVKTPLRYKQYPLMLARRLKGLNILRKYANKYRAYDATFTTDIETIEDEINRVKINLEAAGLKKQLCIMIDNFHDLTSREKPNLQDKQKYDHLAQCCADLAIRQDVPLICSAELRKQNGLLRPGLDSIREAVKIKYEAKAILLCHNDVHYKGEGADVFFLREDAKLKQPVFEVHVAKNKFGTFKGRIFFEMYPEMSRLEEADEQSSKQYASVVYGS